MPILKHKLPNQLDVFLGKMDNYVIQRNVVLILNALTIVATLISVLSIPAMTDKVHQNTSGGSF